MIALIQNMSNHRAEELRTEGAQRRLAARAARRRRRRTSSPRRRPEHVGGAVADYAARMDGYGARLTIRRLDHEVDRAALERVAGRDAAAMPEGELIGAELDGALVAAMSIANGYVVADPFAPTAEAVVLLRRRAEQIGAAQGGPHRGIARRLLRAPLGRAG